jgi:sugar-specific transcriptional regulator TrmB
VESAESVLRSKLGLSPYESRAYSALILKTSVEPSQLTSLTGIPRPRAYDVLKGLVSKGLAVEQSGRPVRYSAIDPKYGLLSLLDSIERRSKDRLIDLHSVVDRLAFQLGRSFIDSRRKSGEDQRIWVTGSSEAVWSQFLFLKEHCSREYVGATRSTSFPPYKIFTAEQRMLERGVKARLVRPFPPNIPKQPLGWYRELMREGFRFRESDDAPFSFDIFDKKEVVLWLNDRPNLPPSEVAWIHHPPLARVLLKSFEEIWSHSTPPQFS